MFTTIQNFLFYGINKVLFEAIIEEPSGSNYFLNNIKYQRFNNKLAVIILLFSENPQLGDSGCTNLANALSKLTGL